MVGFKWGDCPEKGWGRNEEVEKGALISIKIISDIN